MCPAERSLIRNTTGTARDRHQAEPIEVSSLEETIAQNVRQLRLRTRQSVGEMADQIGISKAMLSKIENAQTSCSLGTLQRLAVGLDVPVTTLMRGADAERSAVFTAANTGPSIIRNGSQVGHEYELLGALRGEHKSLMVTLTKDSETYPLFQHPGTEFIHMIKGAMSYGHSQSIYELRPGDSLQFDGEGAHGPVQLTKLPIRFLSIIAFPDSTL